MTKENSSDNEKCKYHVVCRAFSEEYLLIPKECKDSQENCPHILKVREWGAFREAKAWVYKGEKVNGKLEAVLDEKGLEYIAEFYEVDVKKILDYLRGKKAETPLALEAIE